MYLKYIWRIFFRFQQLALDMDVDESGKIDMCEFINSMAKSKREEEAEDDIRQAFQVQ